MQILNTFLNFFEQVSIPCLIGFEKTFSLLKEFVLKYFKLFFFKN